MQLKVVFFSLSLLRVEFPIACFNRIEITSDKLTVCGKDSREHTCTLLDTVSWPDRNYLLFLVSYHAFLTDSQDTKMTIFCEFVQ